MKTKSLSSSVQKYHSLLSNNSAATRKIGFIATLRDKAGKSRLAACAWALLSLLAFGLNQSHAATPYVMSSGNYFENFADIANWQDSFAGGIGAAPWGSVAINLTGTVPDGQKTTVSTAAFNSGVSSGVQRGTGNIVQLSSGSGDSTNANAIDLFLDFTGKTADTISFDWVSVINSTGDRASSLRLYASTNGTAWTEITAAAVLNVSNNSGAFGSVSAALPAVISSNATARIRFYEYNGAGGSTGSRAKIGFDNLAISSAGAPMVVTDPQSRTNNGGTTATFSVAATGSAPHYQWRKGSTILSDGGNILGSTNPTLTILDARLSDVADYSVVLSNSLNMATSAVAHLTVVDTVVPHVMASGNYFENFADIANWADNFSSGIGAATWGAVPVSSLGTIPNGLTTTISTAAFSSSSGVARGSGNIIQLSPGTTDNTAANAIDLFLDFTGKNADALSFDWAEVNNGSGDRASSLRVYTTPDGTTWTELVGAEVLNLANNVAASGSVNVALPASLNGSASVRIRFYEYNATGGTTGSRARISLDNIAVTSAGSIAIITDPQSRTNNFGTTATFNVAATGTSPNYQWRKDSVDMSDGGNVSGSRTPFLTLSNVSQTDVAGYSVVVTNTSNGFTSAVANLTVLDPGITAQPAGRTNVAGDTANFIAAAAGTPALLYQWRFNGADIPGATSNSLNVLNVQPSNQGPYTLAVTNGLGGSAISAAANLTLLPTPALRLARWDFNATNVLAVTNPAPSSGSGSAALVGGTTATFATGSFSDASGAPGPTNNAWNTTTYAPQGTGNKARGIQFSASTLGYENVLLTWEERHSTAASKYTRLQYSTDGINFNDGPSFATTADSTFIFRSADLSGVSGINNNPNFAFRIVAEWESTAINTTNNNFVATTATSYDNVAGTIRVDLVNVFADSKLYIWPSSPNVVLTWTNASATNLQSAPQASGPYTTISNAASGYTTPATNAQRYFRLHP